MTNLTVFLLNIPAIVCFNSAAFLAYHDKGGWGWTVDVISHIFSCIES